MFIRVPITTEVIEKNADLQPNGKFEDNKVVIEFDTRKRDYHKLFNLKRGVEISWINECTFDVQELSGFSWPIVYRITTATGYYANQAGERVYFTPQIDRLSTKRKVSDVVLRLGVFLRIIVGLGSRKASWLMSVLFQVKASKSRPSIVGLMTWPTYCHRKTRWSSYCINKSRSRAAILMKSFPAAWTPVCWRSKTSMDESWSSRKSLIVTKSTSNPFWKGSKCSV